MRHFFFCCRIKNLAQLLSERHSISIFLSYYQLVCRPTSCSLAIVTTILMAPSIRDVWLEATNKGSLFYMECMLKGSAEDFKMPVRKIWNATRQLFKIYILNFTYHIGTSQTLCTLFDRIDFFLTKGRGLSWWMYKQKMRWEQNLI